MWLTTLSGKEVRITFPEFAKHDFLVALLSFAACLSVIALQLAVGS